MLVIGYTTLLQMFEIRGVVMSDVLRISCRMEGGYCFRPCETGHISRIRASRMHRTSIRQSCQDTEQPC